MQSYIELDSLTHYVLEESWVLDIEARPANLVMRLEFVVTEEHPAFGPWGPDEWTCFRSGTLRFAGVTSLLWTDQGSPPARDASGEIDYGHIDVFTWKPGEYHFSGDFGSMEVHANDVQVELDVDAPSREASDPD